MNKLIHVLKHLNFRYLYWVFKNKKVQSRYDVIIKEYANVDKNSVFEGKNLVNRFAQLHNVNMGLASYIAGNTKLVDVKIGRFCSIGQYAKNGFGQHPSKDFVSTHPAFFSTKKQAGFTFVNIDKFEEVKYADRDKKLRVIIGNDVWVGNNVILMDGITIGDGAIIAAGTIVTKDVEPYTIVGGIPAKFLRKRFTDKQIKFLLELKWWDKDTKWLKKNIELFDDIEKLMSKQNPI